MRPSGVEDRSTSAAPSDATDEEGALVARVAAGDKQALATLYDRFSPLLYGLALRMLGDGGEAEDLLHDVFLEVWRRACDFDPTRGTARAWLVMRTRSRALDRLKSPRRARTVALDDTQLEDEPAPMLDPTLRLERERVRRALDDMAPEQRAILELAYFDGLSMIDIGAKLGCPVGTVKSRMSTARDKLRAILASQQRS